MSIRSELETKLVLFAASASPPIPVARENLKFIQPSTGFYLTFHMLGDSNKNRNISASSRITGRFQITCYGELGVGLGALESLADRIVNIYPVLPKIGIVSIEEALNVGQSLIEDNFVCIPITGKYRVEMP